MSDLWEVPLWSSPGKVKLVTTQCHLQLIVQADWTERKWIDMKEGEEKILQRNERTNFFLIDKCFFLQPILKWKGREGIFPISNVRPPPTPSADWQCPLRHPTTSTTWPGSSSTILLWSGPHLEVLTVSATAVVRVRNIIKYFTNKISNDVERLCHYCICMAATLYRWQTPLHPVL